MIIHHSLTTARKIILVMVIGAALVSGLTLFLLNRKEEPVSFRQPDTGLSFSYDPRLIQADVNEADQAGGILARFENVSELTQDVLITIRRETGLSAAASISRTTPMSVIMDSIKRSYPSRFPGFNEQNRRVFHHAGIETGEVIFTYDGQTGERVQQRFIVLMKDDDQAIYISFQAKEIDFEVLNSRYFNQIAETIEFK